jgi:crotonobetainyl-CoA:carnitine CoA-transferase CaiB-like acyl-CoA transferase
VRPLSDSPPAGPLAGVRVVDASRVLAGPFCGMLLGDLGADVVKLERPGTGDETRAWGPPFAAAADGGRGDATYFLSVNRNKRSLTVNLGDAAGREVLARLAARADVFLENFRPGTQAALGADWETLSRLNPRLIYCSVSGFGPVGPDREKLGYDLLMQGAVGLMSTTGAPGGAPVRVGVAVIDLATGATALGAVVAALYARERTGRGQRIDCALLTTGVAWMTYAAQSFFATGRQPAPSGSGHPNLVPYQAFQGSDGRWFLVAVGSDDQWRRFCRALDLPQGADAQLATNAGRVAHREALITDLTRRFAAAPAAAWIARLEAGGVPAGPVRGMADVFADPQVAALGLDCTLPHPAYGALRTVGTAFRLSETPASLRLAPPLLGQHTDPVLAELGFDPAEIARLRAAGAV